MERHQYEGVAVGVAVVAVPGLVASAAVLAWHRSLQNDLVRGRCCTPAQGLYGTRALLMHEDSGLFRARLCLGSVLHVGEKSDHTRASLVRYDAAPL